MNCPTVQGNKNTRDFSSRKFILLIHCYFFFQSDLVLTVQAICIVAKHLKALGKLYRHIGEGPGGKQACQVVNMSTAYIGTFNCSKIVVLY